MKHINGFTVAFSDDSPFNWTELDMEHSTLEEYEPCAAVKAYDDCLLEKIKLKAAETSSTNNSLIVYTSSVNSTNIEDRTMNAMQELNKVNKEINELMEKLRSEAKRVGSVLLTADLTVELLDNEEDVFSDAWMKVQKVNRRTIEAAEKGEITKEVVVYAQPLEAAVFGAGVVRISEKFMDNHDDFCDYIEETYAVPLRKLNAKRHALKQAVEAERALSQL